MPPLDRYLSNLAKLLPANQREDILRELSEDIQSEMEDKESELGRPLTETEQIELLKRRGNPLQVASGYTENKGTLAFGPQIIGPVLFPFYVRVLTFNLGLTFLIVGAIFAALSLAGQPFRLTDLFSSVMLQLLLQLTAVTVIFALVEKRLACYPHDWNQQEFEKNLQTRIQKSIQEKLLPKKQEVSRFDSIAALIATSIALLWFQSLWAKPFLIFGPAASEITFAPIWHRVYLPTVIIMLAAIVRASINIAEPNWVRFRDVASVISDAAGLAVIYALIFAGTWVVPIAGTAGNPNSQHLAAAINRWIPFGLSAAAIVGLAQAIKGVVRLYKNWRWRDTAKPAGNARV